MSIKKHLQDLSISEKRHPDSQVLVFLIDAVIGLLPDDDNSEGAPKRASTKKKEQDATE